MAEIRFFRDSSGRRIAYAVEGAGKALICPAWWVSHVEEDRQHPPFARFFEALAAEHTVVRYDRPGVGLSDRTPSNTDLEGEAQVLEELVAELGLDEVSLLAVSCGGPIALAYAARRRVKLRRLVPSAPTSAARTSLIERSETPWSGSCALTGGSAPARWPTSFCLE